MARPRLRLSTEPRLASGGEAVARAEDGRVVFIEGAAPSEQIEAEILETHARYLRARVVQVLEPGPSRVEPKCPHFGKCGGGDAARRHERGGGHGRAQDRCQGA